MIPLVKTGLPPKEILLPALEEVLYSGYIAQGKVVDAFEEKFCQYIGNNYSVSVNSGTSALHIALILAGVKAGDEVISTPITAEPTNTSILQTGAKVIFADVDYRTGNLDPKDVIKKITSKTKAIMIVHYAGMPVDIDAFQKIEEDYGIPVIEDAAHALGAKYRNKKIGNHFKYSTFSFQAIKHMTTIDGGMLCLRNEEDYEKAKIIRWFGLDKKKTRKENNITTQGYKYHMNNVNAQIGLVQLNRIEKLVHPYIENGKFFDEKFKDIDGVKTIEYYENSEPSYWLYTMKVENREEFIESMAAEGIMVSDLHKRNDLHSIFNSKSSNLKHTDSFTKKMVHIPCGWWLEVNDRTKIVEAVKRFYS
ncbi:pyridoxal-5'-phosphate-dependent protein [Winogradskyella sp. PC-19]|uniref:DegT/DnrJ/EryC1/StrS family aminotransferase n=1 Tax=Winogradskyella sp. PC-19 TaxID=754417 RepID=UPI000B3C59A8|nr:DegT/DnrJ/EryC1/StrS family aminotransferase [Winogradskyella sp. PC-19]ARV09696.1 pyridoxal-5'-phosphate-dependent protein [Winogradskyella sp. PC-19]